MGVTAELNFAFGSVSKWIGLQNIVLALFSVECVDHERLTLDWKVVCATTKLYFAIVDVSGLVGSVFVPLQLRSIAFFAIQLLLICGKLQGRGSQIAHYAKRRDAFEGISVIEENFDIDQNYSKN